MALVGHWANLQEAEKLTQSVLIGGLVQEYIKNGGVLGLTSPGLPVAQFNGLDVMWNREKDVPEASFVSSIGAILLWQSGQDFVQLRRRLKSVYVQTYLDNFIPEVYQTINNYEATQLVADKRAMIKRIEASLIYGNEATAVDDLEFDGFHTLASTYKQNMDNETLDIDQGGNALSLMNMRILEDHMKHGIDYYIMPKALGRRFDSYAQEGGIQADANAEIVGRMSYGKDELGNRVSYWNDTPIIRSDWMVPEVMDSGLVPGARRNIWTPSVGNPARVYSILAVKFGNVYDTQPGLTLAWGNNGGNRGELWKMQYFDKFEDRDAAGLRLITHLNVLDGSTMAIGRIYDIADARLAA